MQNIHASCVAIGNYGVLLIGPSGSGKSDLTLRLLDQGAKLVADDRTEIIAHRGRLFASPPANLAGLMEVRGIGIVKSSYVQEIEVKLIAQMVEHCDIERLPEIGHQSLEGIDITEVEVYPFEASAPAKLRLALKIASGELERA